MGLSLDLQSSGAAWFSDAEGETMTIRCLLRVCLVSSYPTGELTRGVGPRAPSVRADRARRPRGRHVVEDGAVGPQHLPPSGARRLPPRGLRLRRSDQRGRSLLSAGRSPAENRADRCARVTHASGFFSATVAHGGLAALLLLFSSDSFLEMNAAADDLDF